MKKIRNLIIAGAVAVVLVAALFVSIILTAGGTADALKTYAVRSFGLVAEKTQTREDGENGGWQLSPDGGATVFFWGGNLTAGLRTSAAPFLAAGLDISKLPAGYAVDNDLFTVSIAANSAGGDSALSAMQSVVNANRSLIGYHSAMGHFNISLGNGNAFEWAQSTEENEKDVVFALAPEPLVAAGLDPEAVEGWTYDKVEMHEDGKTMQVYMLMKAFNLD